MAADRADHPPPGRAAGLRLHAAAAVVLLALRVGLLSAAIATGQLVGWLLGLLIVLAGGLGGIAAVGAVQARYRQGPVEAELSTQIRQEQHLARKLDLLRPLGWTVLHDRLAPGTEHRLAHVLAGPGGLVVATVLLVAEPLRRYGQQLYTGEVALQKWFTTRWWEAWTLQAAVTARLGPWPWRGLAYPLALMPDDAVQPVGQVPPGMLRYPRGQDGVRIRAAARSGPLSRRCRRRWAGSRPPSSAPRFRRPAHPPQCRTACSTAADPFTGGRHRHNQLRATTDSLRTAPAQHAPGLPASSAACSRCGS